MNRSGQLNSNICAAFRKLDQYEEEEEKGRKSRINFIKRRTQTTLIWSSSDSKQQNKKVSVKMDSVKGMLEQLSVWRGNNMFDIPIQ
jgi:hypothetical protein